MKLLSVIIVAGLVGTGAAQVKTSTAKPTSGNTLVSKSKNVQLVVPAGWYRIAADNPAYKTALKKIGAGGAAANLESLSAQADLMAMDLAKRHPSFQRNLNVIPAGGIATVNEKTLEQAFKSIQNSMAQTKLDHKLLRFSGSLTLCYWGNYKSPGSDNDLIGYVVSLKGKAFVISFSCAKGEMEKFRPLTESIMQTVKAK
jgi:hypothetical protein